MEFRSYKTLKFGNLDLDREETARFIFVPMDFDFKKEDEFKDIMKELQIKKPDLTFLFKANWGVFPNLDERETEVYHQMRPREYVKKKQTWVGVVEVPIWLVGSTCFGR